MLGGLDTEVNNRLHRTWPLTLSPACFRVAQLLVHAPAQAGGRNK